VTHTVVLVFYTSQKIGGEDCIRKDLQCVER